ncbi:hypothetical protein FVR03_09595 [Pontibacter qinzhouensis]|uniref:Uncharacterized protein n=1 Tax=Pontibacter qinzhouensis TaxID=2603253 RepID=A0A5C8KAU5_9BACT|nr:hypothetical protein FVR03_09595 [Pontibacter qinzhouensis]
MLAYPRLPASYTVSVRQFRLLQSRFLHCTPHDEPACGLLIGFANLPIRDLHPLDNLSIFHNKIYSRHTGRTQQLNASIGQRPAPPFSLTV